MGILESLAAPFIEPFQSPGARQKKAAGQARKDAALAQQDADEWIARQGAYGQTDAIYRNLGSAFNPERVAEVGQPYADRATVAAETMAPGELGANTAAVRDQRMAAIGGLADIVSGRDSIAREQAARAMGDVSAAQSSAVAGMPIWDAAAFRAAATAGANARAQIANESALAQEQERRNALALQLGSLGEAQAADLDRQRAAADIGAAQAATYGEIGDDLARRREVVEAMRQRGLEQRAANFGLFHQMATAPYLASVGLGPSYAGIDRAASQDAYKMTLGAASEALLPKGK